MMLSPIERTANKREFQRIEWEEISLYDFVREFWPVIEPGKPFVDGKHIHALCQHLEAAVEGKILRLIVNMPPRHAKSTIISVLFRVWVWIRKPQTKWLCASYALSLATRDNVKCRRLILSPKFQEHYGHVFKLTKDQNAKIKFENDKSGSSQAVSVGSSATGEGGDILLIDDPHGIDEKRSDVTREGTLDWFKDTWCTRLNDQKTSIMIVVGQRVHDQDLSGYILSGETGEHWVHLNLATEYEPEDKCVTHLADGTFFWEDWREVEGDLLWPERFPAYVVERAKKRHGAMGFAALYQQRPVPAGGGQFKQKWFRYFHNAGTHYELETPEAVKRYQVDQCQRMITVDLAISEKQTADFTVFSVWAVTPEKELLLLDRLRDRIDNPEQQKQLQLLYQRYHPGYIQIENVAYQLALIQQLRKQGLPIREYKPVKDKVARATTASVFYEAGRIYHPKNAAWLQEWEQELLLFPMGRNDDQADTVSMACDAIGGPQMSAEDHLDAMKQRLARVRGQA